MTVVWRLVAVQLALLAVTVLPSVAIAQVPPAAKERGANDDGGRLVSIALVQAPVAEALERLAAAAQLSLLWDARVLEAAAARRGGTPRVSCQFERAAAERILGCITREAGLDYYRLSSGTYVVIAGTEEAPGYASLFGVVVDSATGVPIPSARVRLAEHEAPRLANDDGYFAFERLLPGRYDVTVQAIGYRARRLALDVGQRGRLRQRVSLARVEALAPPIIVNGIAPSLSTSGPTSPELTPAEGGALVRAPGLFLPGAVSVLGVSRRDGTGDLHIQGGEVGEHQWRVDGIPMFDAAALSGLVGVVAAPAIDRLTVRRAGFRARDGSALSGAFDLAHALGNDDGRAGASGLLQGDPFTAAGRFTAPFTVGGRAVQTMVAARQGMWRWTAPQALRRAIREWNAPDPVLLHRLSGFGALPGMSNLDGASFASSGGDDAVSIQDVHAAVRAELPRFQRLDASVLSTTHTLEREGRSADAQQRSLRSTEAYRWTTVGGQLSHRALLGRGVMQRLQLRAVEHALQHHSAMSMAAAINAGMDGRERNAIREVALAGEWVAAGGDRWEVASGVELAHARAELALANAVLRPIAVDVGVARATGFGDVTWRLRDAVWMEGGLRVTQLQDGGTYAEPRLALRGDAGRLAWRLSGGGYHQFVNQFDIATTSPVGLVPSLRWWLPAEGERGVPQAWHLAAEGVLQLGQGWEVRGELYGKWQPRLLSFDYRALFAPDELLPGAPVTGAGGTLGALTRTSAFVGTARGRGAGGGVRATHDGRVAGVPLRVEVAYDVGTARRTFPSRFGGSMQPPPWLEPHRASFALEARPGGGLLLAARGRGVWGRSWALRQAFYDLLAASPAGSGLPIDAPGSMRRPTLLEADLGVTWEGRIGRSRLTVGGAVVNAFDRRNVLDYGLQRDAVGGRYVMVPRYLPGRQPSLTLQLVP